MMCHKNNDLFSRKSIRRALKAWRNIQELDGHSLSRLKIVEEQKRVVRQIGMSLGQGMALRDLLRDAIEKLKPDNESPDFADKRWRSYLILTKQFIEGRAPGYVANLLGISHSTYNHSQATALDVLGNVLHELERNHANLDNRWAHECGSTLLAPPHPSHSLVGRHKLLKEVKKELFAGHSLAFTGLPGVGKTALAIELVNDSKVLNHFQDGVLWAHLGCKANVLSVLGIWAAALGISWVRIESLTSVEERARAVHAAIGQRQMLLVVDDARDAEMALTFRLGGRRCAPD